MCHQSLFYRIPTRFLLIVSTVEMDDFQDGELALQLMLQDLTELEDQQKGKHRADEPTDIEIAMDAMKREIHTAQILLQDRILATRAGTAMYSDAIPLPDDFQDDGNEPSAGHARRLSRLRAGNCRDQSELRFLSRTTTDLVGQLLRPRVLLRLRSRIMPWRDKR